MIMLNNEECLFVILSNDGTVASKYNIPLYPEEISDGISANWNDTTIVGRSAPISNYVSTSDRQVSFSFTIHREMYTAMSRRGTSSSRTSMDKVDKLLKGLRSAVYPKYETQIGMFPTISMFVFGEFIIKGKLTNVSFTWKKPIVDNKYQVCDVSVTMNSIANRVKSTEDIRNNSYSPMNPFGNTRY